MSGEQIRREGALPELLAPAGSPDALAAAVAAGADAVYLSGTRFGARRYAANFPEDGLAEAIAYAHLRGVRVYVTVNTLIRDAELADVAAYLVRLYEVGADAVLVQDSGVAALARQIVPDLPVHASTQMTVHNREGVVWAAEHGFSRVVLAREMPLSDIEAIARDARTHRVGLEVFVHGALCYCYSGQCLLSSVIGGRSGNRGICAQPCRKPYDLLVGGKDDYGRPVDLRQVPLADAYLLSTRDLAVYPNLDAVVAAPVASLKIEGRMRSPEYVATVVDIYRRALDGIAAGGWRPGEEDRQNLALAFTRGFTAGYLLGDRDVMGRDLPGNRGIFVGTVTAFNPRRKEVTVRLAGTLVPAPGDGLAVCLVRSGSEEGMVVRTSPVVQGDRMILAVPFSIESGSRISLTRRAALEEHARQIAAREPPAIPLDVSVSFEDAAPVLAGSIRAPDGRELRFRMRGPALEPARSRPLTAEQLEAQFTKTGGTRFVIPHLRLDYPGGLFAPLSELNRLRREFLDRAAATLAASFRPGQESSRRAAERLGAILPELAAAPARPQRRQKPTLSVYTATLDEVRGAVSGGARTVFFEPAAHPGDASALLIEAAGICRNSGAQLVWKWPSITDRRFLDAAAPLLPSLAAAGIAGVMVSGVGAAVAATGAGAALPLYGAAGLNVWNHRTVAALAPLFAHLTLSPELSGGDLAGLVARSQSLPSCPRLEIIVEGNLEALVTEDRLLALASGTDETFRGLRDSRRRVFPIRADAAGRTYLANAVETSLIDHVPDLLAAGYDSLAIDARGRTGRYAQEMAGIYRSAIEAGSVTRRMKEEVKRRSCGGITAGHFLRGVQEAESSSPEEIVY
ncbi:U32 family peptidase [Methanoculleus sp. FWC-SCC1]|uniref:U32 family peptidase n=1 Tax=Methanoculleus frigidifontis TaxID=2584085 RepID=A0ABT8M679_9EURY|nr:U32 family peptidase [Methanoculleus sp. FWC-SCC1]MDN7023441.1 U32 family peptidase [Methanoculleus sp. FWC-SCC1]